MSQKVILLVRIKNVSKLSDFIDTVSNDTGFSLEEVEVRGSKGLYGFEYSGEDFAECLSVLEDYKSEPLDEMWGIVEYSVELLDINDEITEDLYVPEIGEDGQINFNRYKIEEDSEEDK